MQFSSGLERWADKKNMQEASRVINILTKYKIENNEHLASVTLTDYAKMGALSEQLNSLNTQIEDLSLKIKTARKIQKFKPVIDEVKTLSGRKKSRFEKEHQSEISSHNQDLKQMKEFFPDGHFPTPESMDKKETLLFKNVPKKIKNILF